MSPSGSFITDHTPKNMKSQSLPEVAEAVLLRRRRRERSDAAAAQAAARDRKKPRQGKAKRFVRAEALIAKARKQNRSGVKLERLGKRGLGALEVSDERKLAIAVRIRGVDQAHPRIRLILRLLRLRTLNSAVFLHLNRPAHALLKIVEPYITWG